MGGKGFSREQTVRRGLFLRWPARHPYFITRRNPAINSKYSYRLVALHLQLDDQAMPQITTESFVPHAVNAEYNPCHR